ncbi:histidine ammonia-lyase [Tistlia consotensis]|uniref:Histidine ammonia-lyase n=1 Tax=Tistlia consotensis USBA 355 TaxID=560819 RepID=A0A1Y6C899_9PROT|nr:aromatic amino acid lyase [Tistlia consotensis]SMF51251.1 histidine ammonia-lyase [Tistlia consotensis USBA 355]SNR84588.1 histidine ammonia-lyase [Tistlia consotensis]
MTLDLVSRSDFTLESYRAVAWDGRPVRFGAAALARMADCRAQFLRLLDSDPDVTIYGVTSGYGSRADRRFGPEERREHARQPPFGVCVAFGPPLPQRVARGIVFARLANYVEGHAAVSPELAAAVAGLLDGTPLPAVSAMGQGGAGEILGLAPLFLELASRFPLAEKEALALINGSPCATALISDAALAAERRLALAEAVFALSAEAIRAPLEAYAPELEELWNDPHEAAALAALRHLLHGGGAERRPYQAPVSYRILPRVLGQSRRALAAAREVAGRALGAVTDNPVFLPADAAHPRGRVYSTGGYHNGAAYPALDNLAAAAADLCLIADRHTSRLLDGRHSLLPDQLQAGEGRLGLLGAVQVGYAEEAKRAAQRSFLPGSDGGGFGQNDVSPPTFLAWRGQETASLCLEAALAGLAAVASQALFVTERPAPPALRELLGEIRATVPPVVSPRALGPEVGRLAAAFRRRIHDVAPALAEG